MSLLRKSQGLFRWLLAVMLLASSLAALPALAQDGPGADVEVSAHETAAAPVYGELQASEGAEAALYIIQLTDAPLAGYDGGVAGLTATSAEATGAARLDVDSPAAEAYLQYLAGQQQDFIGRAEQSLGRSLDVVFHYDVALNGLAVRLTPAEAQQVAELSGVLMLEREQYYELLTDVGPEFIGAGSIWDGSATGTPTKGEGVIVGILDTGINSDHPSFADIGGDGYDHTNPFGSGVYVGWCNVGYAVLMTCNDKLIGMWSYATSSNNPEDDDGHGSHTASTVAGNVVTSTIYGAGGAVLTDTISGVAPHANIIAYDVCLSSCASTAIVAAINQAVIDGVDVINFSISGGTSPWTDANALAFLNAEDAGIFISASAGNSGPTAGTVNHAEPWVHTVAASTHTRRVDNSVINLSGGDTPAPANIVGSGFTAGYGPAAIVYAGNFGDPLCPVGAFPGGTFSGQIVVCDRGTYALTDKALSVQTGGAGGIIIANALANGASLSTNAYAIPGTLISYADGVTLKAWLASGAGHTGELSGYSTNIAAGNADELASFSSRGPSPVEGLLKPDIAAPGLNIWAAYRNGSPSPEYAFLSGTSMAAPHNAGAGALLKALYPTWTPGQIKSALMLTSVNSGLTKDDGLTAADPFDIGSGRVALVAAANTGLVMDETKANYQAASPLLGGDPSTLNLPSMADTTCFNGCSWTRTLTSVWGSARTWDVSIDAPAGLTITVTPDNFTLGAGADQTLTIVADTSALPADQQYFATITLTDAAAEASEAHLMVSLFTGDGIGTEITVNTTDDELNTDSDCSLREAVRAANTNAAVDACPAGSASGYDRINIPAGTYNLTITGSNEGAAATGDLDVLGYTIFQGDGAATTTINANDIDRIFEMPSGAPYVQINDLTITNGTATIGNSSVFGGCIRIAGAIVTFNNAVVSNCQASSSGGGIQLTGGAVILNDTTVSGNTTNSAGGGANFQTLATVTNSTFSGNTALGTTATSGGGGVYSGVASAQITLNNTTLSGNSAVGHGGGVLVLTGVTANLNNVTISNNTADSNTDATGDGGGVYTAGTLNLRNSIIFGNFDLSTAAAADCSGTLTSQGYNLTGSGTGCSLSGTGDSTTADAMLGPLANNGGDTFTHALNTGSPALDAGNPAGCSDGIATLHADQRGVMRPQGAACDIGAYESLVTNFCGLAEGQSYGLGDVLVTIQIGGLGNLDCLDVQTVASNHPNGNARMAHGFYWDIAGLQTDNSTPASGFNVTLTAEVPFVPTALDKLCRYTGSGWDCAASSFSIANQTITRENVSQFSDWTAGDDVGPNAVSGAALRAASPAGGLWLLGLAGVLLLSVVALWRRRQAS